MNLQALAAMDDCEHATGLTLEQHGQRMTRQTAREVIAAAFMRNYNPADWLDYMSSADADELAAELVGSLRAAGYSIVQVVSSGNEPFVKR